MDTIIAPEACTPALLQAGLALRQSKCFYAEKETPLPGGIRLQAKAQDAFCFVDHPLVELDERGNVLHFACDCPDHRASHGFCVHCAALIASRASQNTVHSMALMSQETVQAQPIAAAEPSIGALSYKFCNSSWDLYPGAINPRIPLERFVQVFGDNAAARMLYQSEGTWGGSCFGMMATASMLYWPDSGTGLTDFRPDATVPAQLSLNDRSQDLGLSLHEYIEAMQILQYASTISRVVSANLQDPNCLDRLVERAAAFQRGEEKPVTMCVYSPHGGHAILPFRVEPIDETTDKLHIYDPNHPLQVRYASLTKDSQGHYTDWRFPMTGPEEYSSAPGGRLSMTPYEVYTEAWADRNFRGGTNLLRVAAGTAVYTQAGDLVARATQAGLETFREEVYEIPVTGSGPDRKALLSLPAGSYHLQLEQGRELSVQMAGTDLSVTLTTSAAGATICLDEVQDTIALRMEAANDRYSLEILNTQNTPHMELTLLDITEGGGLELLHKAGKLYATGVSSMAALYINGQRADVRTHISPLEPQEEEEQLIVNSEKKETQD